MANFHEITLSLRPRPGTHYLEICLQGPGATSQEWETRKLDNLSEELERAENNYYIRDSFREDTRDFGQKLFSWLDGENGMLRKKLATGKASGLLILLRVEPNPELPRGVEHLPWELLHNGNGFLIDQYDCLPYRASAQPAAKVAAVDRTLELVFMAASPQNSTGGRLSYEAEEAAIIAATNGFSLVTEVEETGNLGELSITLDEAPIPVDIVHFSGHAGHDTAGNPIFETEDDFGNTHHSSPAEMLDALDANERPPRLVFLSGCSTGQGKGSSFSFASSVVGSRIPYVLAWAQPVGDSVATLAASYIYRELVGKKDIARATLIAMRRLLNGYKSPDGKTTYPPSQQWHLPRLYLATEPAVLVTGRNKRIRNRDYLQEFLDEEKTVKVPARANFIGRRRELQQSLQYLKRGQDDAIGVVLQGTGGLGKSSLAKRLLVRQRDALPIVISGRVDQGKLLSVLGNKLTEAAAVNELNNALQDPVGAIAKACKIEIERTNRYPVFVLDDFEQNFVYRDGQLELVGGKPQNLQQDAEASLTLLNQATRRLFDLGQGQYPRIIVTCRYSIPARFHRDLPQVSLASFQGEDRQRLEARKTKEFKVSDGGKSSQVAKTAAGNPRLLENLLRVVANTSLTAEDLNAQLEKVAEDQRLNLLTEILLQHQTPDFLRVLDLLATYEIPVLPDALTVLDKNATPPSPHLIHGRDLGLVEEIQQDGQLHYLLMDGVRAVRNTGEVSEEHAAAAADYLYAIDQKREQGSLPLELEIIRLGLISKQAEPTIKIGDRLGNRLYTKNQYVSALQLANSLLDTFPENYRLLHNQARAAVVLGDTPLALKAYHAAQANCPEKEKGEKEYASILHNFAGLVLQKGDPDQAMGLYEQSLEILEKVGDLRGKGATLHQMAAVFLQKGDPDQAMGLYEQSLEILEKVGDLRGKGATLHQMAAVFLQKGDPDKAMGLYEQSLEIDEKVGDLRGKGATLHQMAAVFLQKGDPDKAMGLYEQSLEIDEKVGDLRGKGATLHQMAEVFLQKGDPDKAMGLYEQSLEILEKVGDLRGKGATLHQMAEVFLQKGDPDKAMGLYEQSLEILEKVGDLRGKGATLHQMAAVFLQKGDPDKAMGLYEQSLEIDEKVGDLRGKGATLHQMAAVFLQKGDPDKAMGLYEQSLEIKEKVGDLRGKGATLHQMAAVFLQKGDPDKAMGLYEQSLEIKEKVGDLRGKGATLHQMAEVFLQKGDPDKAMGLYEQSLEILEKVGDLRGKGATLHQMAAVFLQKGDPDKAMGLYEQSLEIKEKVGDLRGKGATLHQMAAVFLQKGDPDKAMGLYEQSLEIKEKVGDLRGKGATLHQMAEVFLQKGDPDKAMGLYEQSLEILEKVGDLRGKGATLHQMAAVFLQKGDPDKAMGLYEQSLEILEKVGDLRGAAMTRGMMGNLFAQLNDYKSGLQYLFHGYLLANKTQSYEQKAMFTDLLNMWAQSIGHSHGIDAAEAAIAFLNNLESWDFEAINTFARKHGYLVPFELPEE